MKDTAISVYGVRRIIIIKEQSYLLENELTNHAWKNLIYSEVNQYYACKYISIKVFLF